MEKITKKLATHLTREEKLKYISEDMNEEDRNAMADKLTLMEIECIENLKASIKEDIGGTPENIKKVNKMVDELLGETLKEIGKK